MIVVDVETTGTEPSMHGLVSIGAVDFNNPERQFNMQCRVFEGAHVMEEALLVNGFTREELWDKNKMDEKDMVLEFRNWVLESSEHTVGGQNPFFDVSFLKTASVRCGVELSLPHRIVDLHSIVYYHMISRGLVPPIKNKRTDLHSNTIMNYVGIPAEPRPHKAINGARIEAEAFSRLFLKKSLFPEYSEYPIPW